MGGGVSSVCAVIGIRKHDSEGQIVMVRGESVVPYDRPPLSKGFLKNPEVTLDDISSKFDSFYEENGVALKMGVTAQAIDRGGKTVTCSDGSDLGYDKLLLATGLRPAVQESWKAIEGVHVLRTISDAEALRSVLPSAKSVLIIGCGYLGLELASAALALGKQVTVIAGGSHPWSAFATPRVGEHIANLGTSQGVQWVFDDPAVDIVAGPLVRTRKGETLRADLVICATGSVPNSEIARDALLACFDGIATDEYFQASDPSIFASGDVARFYDPIMKTHWRPEHHLHAKWSGETAGENMAGAAKPFDKVAYFWSDFLGTHMIQRGHMVSPGSVRVFSDPESGRFIEAHGNWNGKLQMVMAFHDDEPRLDSVSDLADEMIRAGTRLEDVAFRGWD